MLLMPSSTTRAAITTRSTRCSRTRLDRRSADAGAHCGLICDASTPTYMLTHWVRRRRGRASDSSTRSVSRRWRPHTSTDFATAASSKSTTCGSQRHRFLRPLSAAALRRARSSRRGQRMMQDARGYVATIVAGVGNACGRPRYRRAPRATRPRRASGVTETRETDSDGGDVVVVGAGVAGLNAALALRAKGFRVTILERDPRRHRTPRWTGAARRPALGSPTFLHGRLRQLLCERHPRLMERMRAAGVGERRFEDYLHPFNRTGYRAEPIDGVLTRSRRVARRSSGCSGSTSRRNGSRRSSRTRT